MMYRGVFTRYLLTELASFALPLGDDDAPVEPHGWQGEPNATGVNFIPWIVTAPGTATKTDGTFADPQQDWRLLYYFTSCGVSREQTESVADRIRQALKDLAKAPVPMKDETWRLTYVQPLSIGAVSRIGMTHPAHHIQTDSVEFWLSKEI